MKFLKVLKNNLYIIKKIFKIHPLRVILEILLNILLTFSRILVDVVLLRYIVNSLTMDKSFHEIVLNTIIIMMINIMISWFSDWYNNLFKRKSNEKIKFEMYTELYNKSISIDLKNYESPEFYNSYKKAIDTCEKSIDILSIFSEVIGIIFGIIGLVGIMISLDWVMIIFSFVPSLLSIPIGKLRNKINYTCYNETIQNDRKREYIKRIFYLKDYSKELKITDMSSLILKDFKETYSNSTFFIKKYGFKNFTVSFLETTIQWIFLIFSSFIYLIYKIKVSKDFIVGDFISLFFAINNTEGSLRSIFSIIPTLEENSLYIDNFLSFLNSEPIIENLKYKETFNENFDNLQFKNVSFKYPSSCTFALKNININIKAKEKIALVGYNGAGKTTLVNLILRLYDPTFGDILVNDLNIKGLNVKDYRNLYSSVLQDFQIISANIYENVLMKCVICKEDFLVVENVSLTKIHAWISST